MMRAICRTAAWLCGAAGTACLVAAALSLCGFDVEWPLAFGIALLAIFADAGAIGWPTAILAAIFFGALAFGFAGLGVPAKERRRNLRSSALRQSSFISPR